MNNSLNFNTDMRAENVAADLTGLKSLPAYHELVTRKGICLPALTSSFITGNTITQIYQNKIFQLRW